MAEAFLKYSPRVHLRPLDGGAFVFVDIASTSHLFAGGVTHAAPSTDSPHLFGRGSARRAVRTRQPEDSLPIGYHGEERLMASAMGLARDLGFGVQCAVADTPAGAQAFATAHHGTIIPPGEERDRLKELSLPLLLQLEGLKTWGRPSVVESIITFFMMLGFKTIGDLSRFTFSALQERWGETGAILWRRVNAHERQVVSPLLPTEPLQDYVHMDFPVSLASLLLHQVQKSVDFLFARLQGRRLVAQKVTLILHCEYSKAQHKIEIEPTAPSRDRDLFLTLLENRLGDLDLENPVRDFELSIAPAPEKSRQLDFFEPRENGHDRLQSLMSLLVQSSLKPGLYRIAPAALPEQGWRLASSYDSKYGSSDVAVAELEPSHLAFAENEDEDSEVAVAPQPYYGSSVMTAPRPTRILREPVPLALDELAEMKILSSSPIERLENGWWSECEVRRDYYFAVSPEGQCLWIFQDPRTEEYFLHGYFD